MKKPGVLFLFIFLMCSSKENQKNHDADFNREFGDQSTSADSINQDTVLFNLFVIPSLSYTEAKSELLSIRDSFQKSYVNTSDSLEKELIIAKAGQVVTEAIIKKIIPFWYGTSWSFEGHTSIPGSGEVACGYFVSTVLRDAGFNVNRYKLAQQGPEDEARIISCSGEVTELSSDSITHFFKDKEDGLYFAGLDFHVGFMLKKKGRTYFIHSNYINSAGVMAEEAPRAPAFRSAVYFVVGISNNRPLIENWILNRKLNTNL